MKPKEICGLCRNQIDTKKDNFTHIIDYKEGLFFKEGFYHNRCYNEAISERKGIAKSIGNLLIRTNKLLNKAGVEEVKDREEVYEIRN